MVLLGRESNTSIWQKSAKLETRNVSFRVGNLRFPTLCTKHCACYCNSIFFLHLVTSLIVIAQLIMSSYYSLNTQYAASVVDKNRNYVSTTAAVTKNKSKKDPQLSSGQRGRRSLARRSQRGREDESRGLANLPLSNLPEDWGTEKDVSEEKLVSSGMFVSVHLAM